MKIMAEARDPEIYYEEIMKQDFNKWTKMKIVAFINMNSDENNQVTMRPRKSTLVRRAENIVLKKEAEKTCKVTQEPAIEKVIGTLVLIGSIFFFIFIGLEIVNYYTIDLPFSEFFGLVAMFLMIIGIPLWVLWMELFSGKK